MSIIDEAKASVKAQEEANRKRITIELKTAVAFILTFVIGAAIGAVVMFYTTNLINSNIDNQVKAKVEAQLKSDK